MEKLNELAEQAKFVADWHGSDWSSALCQDKDGNQAHEIICESRDEAVISTGSNSNEASWLCDYLELCCPTNILTISEAFRVLEKQRDALAAENVLMLKLLTDISENHVEYFSEREGYTFAGVPLDYVSEINTYVSRDVNAENPFPATDAYLNSVRAEGADKVAEYHFVRIDALKEVSRQGHLFHKAAYSDAVNVANLFRAGKDGE